MRSGLHSVPLGKATTALLRFRKQHGSVSASHEHGCNTQLKHAGHQLEVAEPADHQQLAVVAACLPRSRNALAQTR